MMVQKLIQIFTGASKYNVKRSNHSLKFQKSGEVDHNIFIGR